MLEHFGYLNDILRCMFLKKPLPVLRIDQLGSRNSGKTIQDFDFECKATVLEGVKVKTYVFRNMSEQLQDTWKQLKNRWVLFAIGLEYKISETRKTINYKDSEIECRSLYKQNNSEIKLTGLPDNTKYDYVIRHVDEAHQIVEKDWQDMGDAIRGCKQLLEINSCNPWTILNYYIKSVVNYFPQNERKILKEHEDFYFNAKDKRIVHYQNWKLNHFLRDKNNPNEWGQEARRLLEIEILDPISARVRSHGLVGMESGGIYSHLLHKISRLLQPSFRFSGGLDYGFKDDAMACLLLGFDYDYKFVNVIDTLKIENKLVRYDNKQLAREAVEFYIRLAEKNNLIYEYGLTVYCDYSNYTFIEMLNDTAIKMNVHKWLYFRDCVKLKLEFRVGKNIALMASERLNISLEAQPLLDEFRLALWDEKSTRQVPLAGDDHLRDAFDYAIEPHIQDLSANINPYF